MKIQTDPPDRIIGRESQRPLWLPCFDSAFLGPVEECGLKLLELGRHGPNAGDVSAGLIVSADEPKQAVPAHTDAIIPNYVDSSRSGVDSVREILAARNSENSMLLQQQPHGGIAKFGCADDAVIDIDRVVVRSYYRSTRNIDDHPGTEIPGPFGFERLRTEQSRSFSVDG